MHMPALEAVYQLFTGSTACRQAAAMDRDAATGRPGKPACEHTGTVPGHGSSPTTTTTM